MTSNLRIYTRLLELPLFLGMSRNDLDDVVGHTKFGFLKHARGKTVVSEGDACTHLYFLLQGSLSVTTVADDHSYAIVEQLSAPAVLQPERIFGLTQRFTHTYKSLTECHFVRIDKAETLRLCQRHEIFRLNLLNIICTQSQKLMKMPWRPQPEGIRRKIIRFVEERCAHPAGNKRVIVNMEVLAREIHESRLNVSRELNAMHADGSIMLQRGNIIIEAFEQLLMA